MVKILVVDDNHLVVDVLVAMLENGGYTVMKAYSGPECLKTLREVCPDLILLDIMMEPMTGWETLEHIKKNEGTKDIPVLMITAKQLTLEEAQTYGTYIEDYVLKPVSHQQLRTTINQVFSRCSSRNAEIESAKKAGIEQSLIDEYTLLCKNVDIRNRLFAMLESAYRIRDRDAVLSEKTITDIKNMGISIQAQEERLHQIREIFSKNAGRHQF